MKGQMLFPMTKGRLALTAAATCRGWVHSSCCATTFEHLIKSFALGKVWIAFAPKACRDCIWCSTPIRQFVWTPSAPLMAQLVWHSCRPSERVVLCGAEVVPMTKDICPPSGCCSYCWPLFCRTFLLVSCLHQKLVLIHHPWYATHGRLPVSYITLGMAMSRLALARLGPPRSQRWPPPLPFSTPATSRPGAPSAK